MSYSKIKDCGNTARRALLTLGAVAAIACAGAASASVPGISGTSFSLNAAAGYSVQPDGVQIYSWGYGCATGFVPTFAPAAFTQAGVPMSCPRMQLPGPTLVVKEGTTVTVTLANNLPSAAGNTSIVFSGFTPGAAATAGSVSFTGGTPGIITQEAAHGSTVTYTLNTTGKAGTHAYYSGTQADLQIEMGLFGALVVIPATPGVAAGMPAPTCAPLGTTSGPHGGLEYRHAIAAYDHPATCYDREYLWQWSEIDPRIHAQAEAQAKATGSTTGIGTAAGAAGTCPGAAAAPARGCLTVFTEPYHPAYFLINGRSMPDDMDADYAPNYPNQPYNGNPHMHPLEQILIRVIGQGRWEHPFHEHANHVRILARDGNLILSQTDPSKLAGLLQFNTDTYPGQAFDGIFYFSGKGVNWDLYGHTPTTPYGPRPACTGASSNYTPPVGNVLQPAGHSAAAPLGCNPECLPDGNGFFTAASGAVAPVFQNVPPYAITNTAAVSLNYGEWCADHNHPLEANPAGDVGAGGAATLPDPLVATNGLWFNGTPYLGPDAVARSRGPTPLPPGGALQNQPGESGIAFMWHSHNEREITTDDVFPGGMLMMMLVDPPVWYIDETL